MAKKLRTGETTNLGFVRALKERGAEVGFSSPAETMRDELDSITDKKVTFQSTNETVVEGVNSSEPGPGPGDRINLTLIFLDSETGEPVSNFNLIVTNDETGVTLFSGTVTEDRFTISVEKNIRVYYGFSKDGYDSFGGTIGLGEADVEQSEVASRTTPQVADVYLSPVDNNTGEPLSGLTFPNCRVCGSDGMEIMNLDNVEFPTTISIDKNMYYSITFAGNDDYLDGSTSFFVNSDDYLSVGFGVDLIPDVAHIIVDGFLYIPSGENIPMNVEVMNSSGVVVFSRSSIESFNIALATRNEYTVRIFYEGIKEQNITISYLKCDLNFGSMMFMPEYDHIFLYIVDSAGDPLIVPKVEIIEEDTGNVVVSTLNAQSWTPSIKTESYYLIKGYFNDREDYETRIFFNYNDGERVLNMETPEAYMERAEFVLYDEDGNPIDENSVREARITDGVIGSSRPLDFDLDVFCKDLILGRSYTVDFSFFDRAKKQMAIDFTGTASYSIQCGPVVNEAPMTFRFWSNSELSYVNADRLFIYRDDTGELLYDGSMDDGGISYLPVGVTYRLIAEYSDENQELYIDHSPDGSNAYFNFEGPQPPNKGINLYVVDERTMQPVEGFGVEYAFLDDNGNVLNSGSASSPSGNITLTLNSFTATNIEVTISATGYVEYSGSFGVLDEPYNDCEAVLVPQSQGGFKGALFRLYDAETEERIYTDLHVDYTFFDEAGTELSSDSRDIMLDVVDAVIKTDDLAAYSVDVVFNINGYQELTSNFTLSWGVDSFTGYDIHLDRASGEYTFTVNSYDVNGRPLGNVPVTYSIDFGRDLGDDIEWVQMSMEEDNFDGSYSMTYTDDDIVDFSLIRARVNYLGVENTSEVFDINQDNITDVFVGTERRVSIFVYDSNTGSPIDNAEVRWAYYLADGEELDGGTTYTDNGYIFLGRSAEASYISLDVSADGYSSQHSDTAFEDVSIALVPEARTVNFNCTLGGDYVTSSGKFTLYKYENGNPVEINSIVTDSNTVTFPISIVGDYDVSYGSPYCGYYKTDVVSVFLNEDINKSIAVTSRDFNPIDLTLLSDDGTELFSGNVEVVYIDNTTGAYFYRDTQSFLDSNELRIPTYQNEQALIRFDVDGYTAPEFNFNSGTITNIRLFKLPDDGETVFKRIFVSNNGHNFIPTPDDDFIVIDNTTGEQLDTQVIGNKVEFGFIAGHNNYTAIYNIPGFTSGPTQYNLDINKGMLVLDSYFYVNTYPDPELVRTRIYTEVLDFCNPETSIAPDINIDDLTFIFPDGTERAYDKSREGNLYSFAFEREEDEDLSGCRIAIASDPMEYTIVGMNMNDLNAGNSARVSIDTDYEPSELRRGKHFTFYNNDTSEMVYDDVTVNYRFVDSEGNELETGSYSHLLSDGPATLDTAIEDAALGYASFDFENYQSTGEFEVSLDSQPYGTMNIGLDPSSAPKGTSFIFYDNVTQDRIHPLATIHYEILDGAGTQLENGEFSHDLSEGELVLETTVEGAVNANVYFTFSNGDYVETEPAVFGLTEKPYTRNNLGLDPNTPVQHTITATVVNTLSGVPIEDKEITFTLEGTDPEGTVQELTNTTQVGSQWNLVYDEGDYDDYTDLRVSVRVDGYDAVEYSETFSANEDVSVDIQYSLLQTLSLSVLDNVTSEPIEEFNYIGTINYVDGTSEDVEGTSDGNTVDFARFNADSLSITISKEGYGDLTTDLTFNLGEEPYYEEISLLPNITIRASVVDGLGAPYEGGDLVYKLMGGNSGIIEEDTELVSMSSSSSEETFIYTLGDYSAYGYLRVVVTNGDESIKSYTDTLATDNNEEVELTFGERNFTLNIENSVPEGINDGLNIDVSYSDMFGNELENFSLENQGSPLVLTTGLPVADISLHITHENYEDYDTNAVPAVAPETAEDTVYLDAKRFEFNIDLSYDDQPISLGSNVIVDLQGLEIGTNDWVSLDSTDVGPDTSSCILGYTPVDYPDIDPERLRVYAICEEENVYGLSDEFSKYNESVSVSLTPVDRILHLETFESGTTVQIPDGYSDLIDILVDDPNFTPEVLLINDSSDGATQIDTSSVTLSCINVPDETESHLGIVFNESDTFNYATFSSAYYGNNGELVLSSSSDVTNNYLLFNVTDGSDIELPGTSYNSKVSDFVRLWYDELSFGTPVDCNLILFNTVEGYSSAYLGSLEKVDDDYSFFTYEGGIDYKLCVLRRNDGYDDADFRLVCLGDPGTCLVRQEISLDTPDNQVLETLGDDAFTGVIIPAIESREGSSFTIIVEDGTPRVFSECTMVGENQFTCVGETGTFKVSIIVDPDTGDTSVLVENVSFEGGEA